MYRAVAYFIYAYLTYGALSVNDRGGPIQHLHLCMETRLCLYTKRLTQKQKKWQDGKISFNR